MNGSAAKASRRELRRAFGTDAAEAIEQHDQDIRELRTAHNAELVARNALSLKLSARLDQHIADLQRFREEVAARRVGARLRRLAFWL